MRRFLIITFLLLCMAPAVKLFFVQGTIPPTAPETSKLSASPKELLLLAQAQYGTENAADLWKQLFDNKERVSAEVPHLTEKQIFFRYANALLTQADIQNEKAPLNELSSIIQSSEKNALITAEEAWWLELDAARTMAHFAPLTAIQQLSALQQTAYHNDPQKRSARLHGLGMSWLIRDKSGSFFLLGEDAPTSAALLLPDITTYRHYNLLREAIDNVNTGVRKPTTTSLASKEHFEFAESAYHDRRYHDAIHHLRLSNDRPNADLSLHRWFFDAAREKQWWLAEMLAFPLETGHMRAAAYGALAKHYFLQGNHDRSQAAQKEAYFSALSSKYADKKERAMLRLIEDLAQAGGGEFLEKTKEWLVQHEITIPEFTIAELRQPRKAKQQDLSQLSEEELISAITESEDNQPPSEILRKLKELLARSALYQRYISSETKSHSDFTIAAPAITYAPSQTSINVQQVENIEPYLHFALDWNALLAPSKTVHQAKLYSPNQLFLTHLPSSQWLPANLKSYFHTHAPHLKALTLTRGTASLRQLYEAAQSSGWKHAIIQTEEGFQLNTPLIIGPHATLAISEKGGETLTLNADSKSLILNAGTLYISGINVTASSTKRHAFSPFIISAAGSSLTLQDNHFSNLGFNETNTSGGISIIENSVQKTKKSTSEIFISRNRFSDLYRPLMLESANHAYIENNTFENSEVEAIRVKDGKNQNFLFNRFHNNANGITSNGSERNLYIGNIFTQQSKASILLEGTANEVLFGNIFTQNVNGVTLKNTHCTATNDNCITHNDKSAISLEGTRNTLLQNNQLTHNKAAALEVKPTEKSSRFTSIALLENRISKNGIGLKTNRLNALYLLNNNWQGQSPRLAEGKWWKNQPLLRRHLSTSQPLLLSTKQDGALNLKQCSFWKTQ